MNFERLLASFGSAILLLISGLAGVSIGYWVNDNHPEYLIYIPILIMMVILVTAAFYKVFQELKK